MRESGRTMGKNNSLLHFDETRVKEMAEGQCHQFDYASVDEEPEEPTYDPHQVEQMGEVLREMLTWLTMGDVNSAGYGQTLMRKTIAMCWVMRPDLFGGLALSEIAKSKGVNVYKQSLSKQAIKFSEKFGIKGRGQRKKL